MQFEKVTLSWYDPPNEAFAAKCLLHNLDLLVTDPEGRVFYGNTHVRDSVPSPESSRDELNNNEQVHLVDPIPGKWTVRVQSALLFESAWQNYSIVITLNGTVVRTYLLFSLSIHKNNLFSFSQGFQYCYGGFESV